MKIIFIAILLMAGAVPSNAADLKLPADMVTAATIEVSISEVFKDDAGSIQTNGDMVSLRFRDGTDVLVMPDSQNKRILIFEVKALNPASKAAYLELANRLNESLNFGVSVIQRSPSQDKGGAAPWLLVNKAYLPYGDDLSIGKLCSYIREFWHGYATSNLKALDADKLIVADAAGEKGKGQKRHN